MKAAKTSIEIKAALKKFFPSFSTNHTKEHGRTKKNALTRIASLLPKSKMHTYVAAASADDNCYGKLNGMKNKISIV